MLIRNALLKDTRREIRRTISRYLSIFLIMALGTGFFAGLKATCPDMKNTAADFFEKTNLMDIKLVSSIGITADEVSRVNSISDVSGVMPAYSADLFLNVDGESIVVKAMSYNTLISSQNPNNMNRPVLIEGRLPQNSGECAVEVKFNSPESFKIGNKLTFQSPKKEMSLDSFVNAQEYEIVGIVCSPLYIGYKRGYTSVGNGEVTHFVLIPEQNFKLKYYSELYVTLKSLKDADPFSEEYSEILNNSIDSIKTVLDDNIMQRFQSLMADATTKIDKAKRELELAEHIAYSDEETLENDIIADNQTLSQLQGQFDKALEENNASRHLIKAAMIQLERKISLTQEKLMMIESNTLPSSAEIEAELQVYRDQISEAEVLIEQIREPVLYSFDRNFSEDYASFSSDSERINSISKIFPVFFVLIASLICLTTMTRMVEEHRTEIGTLKALGYKTMQIAGKYLFYALSATLLGSLTGIFLGLKILPAVIYDSYSLLYNIPDIETPFIWSYAVIIISAALIMTTLTVFFSCRSELKTQPAQIMRPKAPTSGRRVFLERINILWNRLNFLTKVTLRNLFRYKKRFLMTLAGIAGCTALMLTGFGIDYSISSISLKQFEDVFIFDGIAVISNDADPFNANAYFDREGIVSSKVCYQTSVDFVTENGARNVNLIIPHDTTDFSDYISLQDRKTGGEIHLSDDGIVINEKLSLLLNVSIGDTVTLQSLENKPRQVTVTAINENYTLHYVYMTAELYKSLYGAEPDYNAITFIMSDDSKQSERELASEILENKEILGMKFTSESDESFKSMTKSLDSIVLVLIISAGALAFIVLYNLSNINVTERERELATIKVLGFYDGEVSAYIYRENTLSSIIGMFIGLIFGVFLHRFVIITAEVDIVMFNRSINWQSFVYAGLLTMTFTFIVNFVLHFRLKKIKMVESLKSVE